MHLCLVCDEYPPAPHGGIGSFTHDLAEGLVAAGHRVTVAGIYGVSQAETGERNGVRVVRLPGVPGLFGHRGGAILSRLRLARALRAEHRSRPFDLVECPDYAGWLRFGAPAGVPLVVRFHGSNLFFDAELGRQGDAFEHGLERKLIRRATHLVSPSRYAAESTAKLAGIEARDVTVIPHGIDTNLFKPAPAVAEEEGLIVFANGINPKKGVEELCDAMNIVCCKHPTAHLRLVGGETYQHPSGRPYREVLLERVSAPFRARIEFAGRLDRVTGVLRLLQKAQVCCYPSHMETFGLAPIEAMAVGKPVVYSKLGPGPEVIEDGFSGLLCDPRRPDEIAAALLRALTDTAFAARLGENARARVLSQFDRGAWVARNIAFYQSCVAGGRKSR